MILELHIIQNFAPSNLNRNDTGAPKDCIFGGSRRARISSQCFKRAMREHFKSSELLAKNEVGFRSKRLHEEIARKLKDSNFENDGYGIEAILTMSGIYNVEQLQKADEENVDAPEIWTGKSESLAFLGKDSIERIAELIKQNPEKVQAAADLFRKYREDKRKGKDYKGSISKDDKKDIRNKVKKALGNDLANEIEKCLDGSRAADLALFGRMLADLPDKNVYASSQVAHSISTHKTGVEFDFYTAVDDLKPEDTAGADMLGTVEFNSACFYRYANVNVEKLRVNLQGDEDLTRATVEAYIRAAAFAIPTGKQNSFATHEKPSFVLATVSDAGKCSLANAFEKAVKAEEWSAEKNEKREGLVLNSIEKLSAHYGKLNKIYGDTTKSKFFVTTNEAAATDGLGTEAESFAELIEKTVSAIFDQREA
jgi:CRISPR system Cascade subunit CasC